MLVKEWMTEGSINLGEDTLVLEAANMMRMENIRQMPVIDSYGNLTGIVSDRDIRDAMPSKYVTGDMVPDDGKGLTALKVGNIMTTDPMVVSPNATVETAAMMLQEYKVGGLPVVDDKGELVGIITEVDVFNYLCSVTGVLHGGIQLVLTLEDDPGKAIELVATLKDQDVRLTSVMTSYENVETGYRLVSIRIQSVGKHTLHSLVDFLKDKYKLEYYVTDGVKEMID